MTISDYVSDNKYYDLKVSAMNTWIDNEDYYGNIVYLGLPYSLDFPHSMLGVAKLGLELGMIYDIDVTSEYSTLEGIDDSHHTVSQDVGFANISLAQYFTYHGHPYYGIAANFSRAALSGLLPVLFVGFNFQQIEDTSLNLSIEVRTMAIYVEKEELSFNNFGDSGISSTFERNDGYGLLVSMNYIF